MWGEGEILYGGRNLKKFLEKSGIKLGSSCWEFSFLPILQSTRTHSSFTNGPSWRAAGRSKGQIWISSLWGHHVSVGSSPWPGMQFRDWVMEACASVMEVWTGGGYCISRLWAARGGLLWNNKYTVSERTHLSHRTNTHISLNIYAQTTVTRWYSAIWRGEDQSVCPERVVKTREKRNISMKFKILPHC